MTECAKCGDCCEKIYLTGSHTKKDLQYLYKTSDPRIDDNWERWKTKSGYKEAEREERIEKWVNANFILDHWHRVQGGGTNTGFSCDAFDSVTRLCTAHDERPPICSGFPWYGKPPNPKTNLHKRCVFWNDVPQEQWPTGVAPIAP